MRMRSPRAYESPSNSSKSQPLATTRTSVPGGASAAASSAIAGVTALTAATCRSARAGDAGLDRALGANAAPVVATVRVGEPGVAEIGHMRHAGAARDRGGDDVHRVGRRGREHDIDLALAHCPRAGAHCVGEPGDLGVGQQNASSQQCSADSEPAHAVGCGQARGRRLCVRGPAVARTMHRRLRRDVGGEARVDGAPLRIVGSQHVDIDAELREVTAELEHALHAPAACGREVERHDQDAHRSSRQCAARAPAVSAWPPRAAMPSSRRS